MSEVKIDHVYTRNIICPYCRFEDKDSWEEEENEGKKECPDCEKEFEFIRNVTIDYTTYKIVKGGEE